jgi:predicted nucleic acid-binding protein
MAKYYLETSAFVKRYKKEKGSDFINKLFNEEHDLFYLNLAIIEIRKVFYRLYLWPQNLEGNSRITKEQFLALNAQFAQDLSKMRRIDFTDEMVEKSTYILEKIWLKSVFDLAQLSAYLIAKEIYPDLIFVCSEKSKLIEAAKLFVNVSDIKIPEYET